MNKHIDKTQENKIQSVANAVAQKQGGGESTFQFVGNRPEAFAQRKLQEMTNNSQQVSQLRVFQDIANNSPQVKQAVQLQSMADNYTAQQQQPIQKKENNTGLPDNLKSGIENLSGYSMDDVKVYYNSNKPTQLQAHAYAQGTDIHIASGQEKHLPHEAWHVVQQKQRRVKPTMQMKDNVNINDDDGLEREADVMGYKAFQYDGNRIVSLDKKNNQVISNSSAKTSEEGTIQRVPWPIIAAGIAAVGAVAVWGLYRVFRGSNEEDEPVAENESQPLLREESSVVVEESRPRIGQPIHFVWLGGQVPDQRRDNILRWCAATMASGAVIRLWMDNNSIAASSGQIALLREANVQVVNINSLAHENERIAAAVRRLPTMSGSRVNPPATGALSDIIRLAALQAEGGTYMDSDNLPTESSGQIVGSHAPAGFRLGNIRGVMSNDAISAQRDSAFIESYLQAACANLTDVQALAILGGGNPAIEAVMRTTGPEAMATIPLPDAQPMLQIAARYPGAFGQVPTARLTIHDLRNLYGYREEMTRVDQAAILGYMSRIGMSAFQREQGNAWLPESQRSGGGSEVVGGGILGLPVPAAPLALPALHIHYLATVAAANAVGTFSPEFLLFRDNRAAVMQTLVRGGLSAETVAAINVALDAAFLAQGEAAQGAHPVPAIQEAVFDDVDVTHGRSLWALLRIFRAAGL